MYDLNSIYIAKSIDDAVSALTDNPQAVIISGGTDILVGLRDGVRAGSDFISIKDIEELRGIYMDEEKNIHIRPATTFREIIASDIVKAHIPSLITAIIDIGGPQIRNVATIGGNICNGFTTADAPPTLLGLNAVACITGKDTYREKSVEDFYVKPEVMDLGTGELLTDIVIKHDDYEGYKGHYIKYSLRDAMDIAIIGCSVLCKTDGDIIDDIRISFAAAGPLPLRARSAEKKLNGEKISEELFEKMGKLCLNDVSVITDKRVSKEFRMHLVEVLPGRVLKTALGINEDKAVQQ